MRRQSVFFGMETMSLDIPSIIADLKRHWWNILLVALAGLMMVYVGLTVLPLQKYSTTTVFVVTSNTSDVVSSVNSAYNADTIASALTSVLTSDILQLFVEEDIGEIYYEAEATYTSSANIITLVVTTKSAQTAFLATKSILTHFPSLIDNVMTDVRLITLQQPVVPTEPDTLYDLFLFMVLGFFAGGAAYAVCVILLSIIRDTVKNEADVHNKVDTLHIGTIPYLSRKSSEYVGVIPRTKDEVQVARKFELAAMRIANHLDRHAQKVLMVTSVMPNEGKTTVSIQIAFALAKSRKRVLLIDGDFRNPSVAELLHVKHSPANELQSVLALAHHNERDWSYIPGTMVQALYGVKEMNMSSRYISNGRFASFLAYAREKFDCIIIDTAPTAFVSDTELLADMCDAVTLVVAQDVTLARAVNDAVDLFTKEEQLIGCIFKETRPAGGWRLT